MTVNRVVVKLQTIDLPFYRHFFYTGSVFVFSSVTNVSATFVIRNVTSVMNNVTLQVKVTDGLPAGSENEIKR